MNFRDLLDLFILCFPTVNDRPTKDYQHYHVIVLLHPQNFRDILTQVNRHDSKKQCFELKLRKEIQPLTGSGCSEEKSLEEWMVNQGYFKSLQGLTALETSIAARCRILTEALMDLLGHRIAQKARPTRTLTLQHCRFYLDSAASQWPTPTLENVALTWGSIKGLNHEGSARSLEELEEDIQRSVSILESESAGSRGAKLPEWAASNRVQELIPFCARLNEDYKYRHELLYRRFLLTLCSFFSLASHGDQCRMVDFLLRYPDLRPHHEEVHFWHLFNVGESLWDLLTQCDLSSTAPSTMKQFLLERALLPTSKPCPASHGIKPSSERVSGAMPQTQWKTTGPGQSQASKTGLSSHASPADGRVPRPVQVSEDLISRRKVSKFRGARKRRY